MTTFAPDIVTPKPKTASVSVILPVMIREPWQAVMSTACIEVMRATTTIPLELIVVHTLTSGPSWHPDDEMDGVRVLQQLSRTTYVNDFNVGLEAATGDYVVQTGNDIFTQPGWLEALLECFEKYPDCGAASLGTHEGGGLSHRPAPFIVEGWYDPLMMWRKRVRDSEQGDYTEELPRDLWRLDEAYAGCFSTSDLIMRLYTAGYRCYRNHRVVCSHIGQQTWSDEEMNVVRPAATKLFIERWGNSPLWAATMILAGSVHFGREFMRGQHPA